MAHISLLLWVPFCCKHNIEPRNPDSYFTQKTDPTKYKKNPDFVKGHRWMKRECGELKVKINGHLDVMKRRCKKYNSRKEMKERKKSDSSASSESGRSLRQLGWQSNKSDFFPSLCPGESRVEVINICKGHTTESAESNRKFTFTVMRASKSKVTILSKGNHDLLNWDYR